MKVFRNIKQCNNIHIVSIIFAIRNLCRARCFVLERSGFLFQDFIVDVAVALEVPEGGDDDAAHDGEAGHQQEDRMPAELVGEQTERVAGDQGAELVAESEQEVDSHADGKTDDQVPARVGPVGKDSVQELGDTVDDACDREYDTEAGIGDAEFLLEERHGEREVLPDEIEHRIADHRADDHPPLPVFECVSGCFHYPKIMISCQIVAKLAEVPEKVGSTYKHIQ